MINKEEIRRAREIAELAKKSVPGPWEVMEIVKETDDGQKYPDGYAILGRIEGTDSPMTRFADVGGRSGARMKRALLLLPRKWPPCWRKWQIELRRWKTDFIA